MNAAIDHRNLDPLPIVCDIAAAVEPPSRIKACPWGDVQSSSGNFIMDRQAAAEIIAAFTASKVDIPIDAEHATLGGLTYSTPTGDAPARGWIKSLSAVEGQGLFADVQWTPLGAGYVRNKEYRYLSPVVLVRKFDRRAVALHSVALTNKPAITGMAPIVNSRGPDRETDRGRLIREAGRTWDNEGYLQRRRDRATFIDDVLRLEGLALLSNTERGAVTTRGDSPGSNRAELIKALVCEWGEHPAELQRITNCETYVNGSLLAGGLAGLADAERVLLVVCGRLADEEAGKRKLDVIMGDNPRATAIRKLAKEWNTDPNHERGSDGLIRYVAYNLDVELNDPNTPELTQQERDALYELIREEFASL